MWQQTIPVERGVGITRCLATRVGAASSLGEVLAAFCLRQLQEALQAIPPEMAISIVEALLWKDLAYHAEIMSRTRAYELACQFVYEQKKFGGKFFTNANWSRYHDCCSGFGWIGFTDSTFDGGVIALGSGIATCIWVEDED